MTRAYLLEVGLDRWMAAYRLVNAMLHAGQAVSWALEPFRVGPRTYGRGTFVLSAETASPPPVPAARHGDIQWTGPVSITASLLPLGVPRIAIYGGGGAPYNFARILARLGFLVEFIRPEEIRAGALEAADVFMMPGGGLLAMKGQLDPLGEDGCRAVDRWVRSGGMYVGSCAGAFDAAIVSPSFIDTCPAQRCMRLINARVWNSLGTEWIGLASPGIGVLRARVTAPEHPVMFHLPGAFEIVHYNGPLFEPARGVVEGASEAEGLAVVDSVGERFTPAEYFLRFASYPGRPGPETLIERGLAAGVRTAVAGSLERGRVVLFGSHPEFGTSLIMDDAGVQAMMLANAALWQSSSRPRRRVRAPEPVPFEPAALEPGAASAAALASADRILSLAGDLLRAPAAPEPRWLREDLAMSTFGLPARAIWTETLREFPRLTRELEAQLHRLVSAAARSAAADMRTPLRAAAAMLAYRVPESAQQDFGYEGLLQTLDRCERMLRRARHGWSFSPAPSPNPYACFDDSPYHQAVGSYLAASGVLANACGLVSAAADQIEVPLEAEAIHSAAASPWRG